MGSLGVTVVLGGIYLCIPTCIGGVAGDSYSFASGFCHAATILVVHGVRLLSWISVNTIGHSQVQIQPLLLWSESNE